MTLSPTTAFTLVILALGQRSLTVNTLKLKNDGPVISIDSGQIRGKVVSYSGQSCDAYLGVPFADPPLGRLRFQKPQLVTPWKGVLDTTDFGPSCVQDGSTIQDPTTESEDCLYLNVVVPKKEGTHSPYPVMLFIHGGAFAYGSARDFAPEGMCGNLGSRGVIVITIQYRLNLYGFLSTGDEAALGNYAIWDQIATLRWVQRNIASFGGDPNKVTIFGISAGGASVSLLTYTPVATDLFHQTISESGSAHAYWASINDACVTSTQQLATATNCTNSNDTLVIDCLRQYSTKDLQKIYISIKPPSSPVAIDEYWSIRADGELYTQEILQEQTSAKKPAIIGVNSMEFIPNESFIPNIDYILNSTLDSIFPGNGINSSVLKQTTRYVYIDSKGDRNNATFVTQQHSQLVNDLDFRGPATLEAQSKVNAGYSVWTYKFDYYTKNYFPPEFPFDKGAPHGHEQCYLFLQAGSGGAYSCPSSYDEGDDKKVADYLGEMWTNFAIKGIPSPSGMEWPQFHNVSHANTMHIRSSLDILPDFYIDIANFWNYLVPNIEQDFNSNI